MSGSKHQVTLTSPELAPGKTGSVLVMLDALGNENALGFTLAFDSTRLHFVGARVVGTAAKALLNVNSKQANTGKLGIALALNPASNIPNGKQQVLELTFLALPTTKPGETALSFTDGIVIREICDDKANTQPATFSNGTLLIR